MCWCTLGVAPCSEQVPHLPRELWGDMSARRRQLNISMYIRGIRRVDKEATVYPDE